MGEEKLDNTVYLIRGLYDLADMAEAKDDRATRALGDAARRPAARALRLTWWNADVDPVRRLARATTTRRSSSSTGSASRRWRPSSRRRAAALGLAPTEHGIAALAERESDCFSGRAPFNLGLFHTGCEGGPEGKGERTIFSLNTAIKAVADGNYGRREQQRATRRQRRRFPSRPPEPDEQPGALPEILPSPDQNRNIDRCWTCRSMFMQAWGHYGTAWPVIHQQLGVRPALGDAAGSRSSRACPTGQPRIAGDDIRLGDGAADRARRAPRARYTTTVTRATPRRSATCASAPRCRAGAEAGARPLDGAQVRKPTVRETSRGVEVTVPASTRGPPPCVTVTSGSDP